jgi:hypothetical protein
MSKILRRPMFRGGGQVSSYGKGIAAPLVPGYQMGGRIPGYQMGGNVRGGIVNLPGGYDLTANQRLSELIKNDFGNVNVGTSGGSTANLPEIILGSDLYDSGAVAPRQINIPGVVEEDKTTTTATEIQDVDTNAVDGSTLDSDFDQTESKIVIDPVTGEKKTIQAYVPAEEVKPSALVQLNLGMIDREEYNILKNKEELKVIQDRVDSEESGTPLRPGGEDAGSLTVSEIEELGLSQAEKDAKNITESPEISAKDAIRENQELFKELLGSKKARGQDISDMLLRFSGSQGNTVGEKFQNYTRAESAAGPGRGEKINQTAAALAINDYVAGKRSKEQGELLTKKIDYELDAKNKFLTPQEGDSNAEILRKISTAYKIEPGSNKAIKQLLKFRNPGKKIYGITANPTDKNIAKKLEIGLNIVTHKGAKTIIEKISETETQVIPFSGI